MTNYFYIQNDGVFVPTDQLAGSYAALNIVEKNSLGIGTTTLEPRPNPDNPNWIADVNSSDLWGFTAGGDIYRMTKVGIQNNNPMVADFVGNHCNFTHPGNKKITALNK